MTRFVLSSPKNSAVNHGRAVDDSAAAISDKHISKVSRERILGEVEDKLDLMREWILYGIPWKLDTEGRNVRDSRGEIVPIDFPKNLQSFLDWCGPAVWPKSALHDRSLVKISRSTLSQKDDDYIKARIRIREALANVKERAATQSQASNKMGIIARLEADLEMQRRVIEEQERDLIRLRRIADEKSVKLADCEALVLRNNKEHMRLLAEEQAKNAELTGLLGKLSSIRLVRK